MDDSPRTRDPLPPVELQRRAIRGSIWTAINTLVFLPVAFAANAIIARKLGVADYGHLAFLTAMLAFAFPLANLGFATAFLQRGSRAEAAGRRAEADDLFGRSLGFHLLVQLPILIVIAGALTRRDPPWEQAALAAVVVLPCILSGGALSMMIENRSAAGAKLGIIVLFIVQGASVLTALLTASASAVWAVRALVPSIALVLNFLFLDPTRRRRALRPRLPRGFGRSFWRFALLSWAAGLLGLLVFSRSEIFILQALHKHEALGLFAVAFGLSQQMTAPADALITPLLPAVAGIVSSWPERARHAFERSTRLSALLCGAIAAVAVPTLIFALPIVYGRDFTTASWLLVPLALVSMIQSVNNPVTAFVNARERGGLKLKATTAALVVDVAVALALIPSFGAWGAVAANVAGQFVVLIWLASREPHVRERGWSGLFTLYLPFSLGVMTAAGAISAGLLVRHWSGPIAVATAALFGAVLFPLTLRMASSGLNVADRDALLGAMSPRLQVHLRRLLRPITSPGTP